MTAKLNYVLTIAIFLFAFSGFAQNNFFVKIGNRTSSQKSLSNKQILNKESIYRINYLGLSQTLSSLSQKTGLSKSKSTIIQLPNTAGELKPFRVVESSVLHPDLQAKYPEIKSYVGYSIDPNPTYMRFSLSPYYGLSGIVLGEKTTLVYEPVIGNPDQVVVSKKSDLVKNSNFNCHSLDLNLKQTLKSANQKDADDSKKRTYRIAISVSGEYSQANGGTFASVNAAINATLTNVNAVYENDLNITLQLISSNDDVIYLNPATDPYTGLGSYNSQLANTLDTEILEANYDVGHLLAGINDANGDGTGDAGCIGCVCNNGGSYPTRNHKGSGYSTSSNPNGINFDIDFVAHEIGHQFGGTHTWTHDGNEGNNSQVEPGSGSTIMGYSGITGATNLQLHSDPYFHAISIEQITNFVKSTTCATITDTGNTTPIANAGSDLVLPVGTAFKLIGEGSDLDSDAITFCWEQINEDNAATTYPNPNSSNSNSVLFRSFPPTTDNTRYFPNLSDLKFGVNATQWEKIPSVSRTADFRLTVRDNRPGGANNTHDDMRVNFDDSFGPFEVTSQNNENIIWQSGKTETITWNVNNTNSLSGASTVNILLSLDGGLNYSTTLATNIANNGNYSFTVPNIAAPYCRILIEPTNNVFYAINSTNFAINYEINTTCTRYSSNNNLNISITDNGRSFTESHSINVNASSTITDVNIGVDISHTHIGDLEIAVVNSGNNEVLLKSHQDCGNGTNMKSVYDDESIPYNCLGADSNNSFRSSNDLLALFNGQNAAGNWTIKLGDFEVDDIGTLNSWFIEICDTSEIPLDVEPPIRNTEFKLFPNPNNGEFTIKLFNPSVNSIHIDVFDLRGRLIYKRVYEGITDFDEDIKLKQVQSGLYLLKIYFGTELYTRKIIIK
ncbi:reprolysin-like metallopeptidase [uncultured Algibacter sp.]|uniref:zinc-dependent metalloprotease n=1 Tax=uncultured Algibacter sp. TaxID=298659 RepID=UPI002603F519|nr:zinc-dependent metalloprotease family protein [uncultured Algibacter sp.]